MKNIRKITAVIVAVTMVIGFFGILPAGAALGDPPIVVTSAYELIAAALQVQADPVTDIVIKSDIDLLDFAETYENTPYHDPNFAQYNQTLDEYIMDNIITPDYVTCGFDGYYPEYISVKKVYNWEPLVMFDGTITGNSKTISGLYIDPVAGMQSNGSPVNPHSRWLYFQGTGLSAAPDCGNIGLVSTLTGTINDLNINVYKIEGDCFVGAFAGTSEHGIISGCSVSGMTTQFDSGLIIGVSAVGGLVGRIMDIPGGYTFTPGFYNSTPYPSSVIFSSANSSLTVRAAAYTPQFALTGSGFSDIMNSAQNTMYGSEAAYIVLSSSTYESDFQTQTSLRNSASLMCDGSFAGGIAGLLDDNGGIIAGCTSAAYVRAVHSGAGAIVGTSLHGGIIDSCTALEESFSVAGTLTNDLFSNSALWNTGARLPLLTASPYYHIDEDHRLKNLDLHGYYGGGIIGASGAGTVVENCTNYGYAQASNIAGGIAGTILFSYIANVNCMYTEIANCSNCGPVASALSPGGIAGAVNDMQDYWNVISQNNANQHFCVNCKYCSSETIDGYCDNRIENCRNGGVVYNSAAANSGIANVYDYGGITALNSGLIRNCYSALDDLPASICSENHGVIEHCFGRTPTAYLATGLYGSPLSTGICTNYRMFSFDPSGMPVLTASGIMTSSLNMLLELNEWVNYYGYYVMDWDWNVFANYPFRTWDVNTGSGLEHDTWIKDISSGASLFIPVFDSYFSGTAGRDTNPGGYSYSSPPPQTGAYVSHSLSMMGDIGVNFYVNVLAATGNCYAEFTYGEATLTEPIDFDSFTIAPDGTVQFKFSCPVNASQISTKITCVIHDVGLDEDGNEIFTESEPMTYSVNEYIEEAAQDPNCQIAPALIDLMAATSVYGHCANALFGTDPDFTDSSLFDMSLISAISSQDAEDYAADINDFAGEVNYYGSSLMLLSETAIRHYFTIEEGRSVDDYRFEFDGETLEPVKSGRLWYVEIPGVPSPLLGKVYSVMVYDNASNTLQSVWNYSGLSYAYKALLGAENETVSAELGDVARALVYYYNCANAYFFR